MTRGLFEGSLYAANTGHHRVHDDAVLAGVPLPPGTRVLDVGCGSGDLTARVAQLVAPGAVLGLDVSPSQVEHARRTYGGGAGPGGPTFTVGRAQDLAVLVPPGTFDVVLSVATLHWVPAPEQRAVLTGAASVLVAGGVLRVDMGGSGQIAAARALLDELVTAAGGEAAPWCFPEPDDYAPLVEAAGFAVERCRLVAQRRAFPTPEAAEGWLRSQVLPAYLPSLAPADAEAFAADAVRRALVELRRADGTYDQDYVRLDVLARRRG